MSADVTVEAPVFLMDQQHWKISIDIAGTVTETLDGFGYVVPLIFFVKSGIYYDMEPCGQVTDMCCLAQKTKERAWKGDIPILDMIATQCETSKGGDLTWSNLTEFAGRETKNDFFLTLTREDLTGDDKRAEYRVQEGVYDVSVLVLLVQKWNSVTDSGQSIRVETHFRTVRIDLQRKNDNALSSVVDSAIMCSNQKPVNAFYVPRKFALSEEKSRCEWFCKANYIRCPLYATDDEASCVVSAVSTSRVYFIKVGVLSSYGGIFQEKIDILNQTRQLQQMSRQFLTSLASDDIMVRECLLSFTTENLLREARVTYDTVDSDVVMDRSSALQLTETFAIVGDMSPVRMNPASQIAYSGTDDDRFQTGFLEYNVLMYIEIDNGRTAEHGKLRVQAENIRRILNDFFMYEDGNATVLYVSNVDVLDGGFQETEYISGWNITLFIFWGVVIVSLLMWNLLCPSGVSHCADVSCGSSSNNKISCIHPQHSPYGARIIFIFSCVLFVAFLGLLVNNMWVLLPSVDIAPDRQPFMALAFFGATLLPAIALYVCFCTGLQMCLTCIK